MLKEQETQSAAVRVDGTRTSALFKGHRAVGERRGLAHALSGREDRLRLPPVHGASAGPAVSGSQGSGWRAAPPWTGVCTSSLQDISFCQVSHPGPLGGAEPGCVSIFFPLTQVCVLPWRRESRSSRGRNHSWERGILSGV